MAAAIPPQFRTPENRPTSRSPTSPITQTPSQGFLPVLQEYTLLAEYKRAQKHASRGVYVTMGAHGNWDGVIFLHSGMYEGGMFRFRILIPAKYPTTVTPRVFFQSTVYHPEVDIGTGELSLKSHFPKWREGKDQLWHIIKYIRYIFYNVAVKTGVNTDAAALFRSDEETFRKQVKECVDNSNTDMKKEVPTKNEISMDGRANQVPPTDYAQLIGTMLGWGQDVASGKVPSMAEASDRVNRLFGDAAIDQVPLNTSLRGQLKRILGSVADTGDTRLSDNSCKGWLSIPSITDDWQRCWVSLEFTKSDVEHVATGSVSFYENEQERDDRIEEAGLPKPIKCNNIIRAYQPNTSEMKMGNMFMVVLDDRVIRFQAPSTNAVRVWLEALCLTVTLS